MQYVMLVRVDPDLPAPDAGHDADAWVEEGTRTGMRVEGGPLEETSTATTVRVRDGKTLISDGPYAETKEFIAGYDLLEADDLEQAIDYASRHPVAAYGALEVREVWDGFVEDGPDAMPKPVEKGTDYLFIHAPATDGRAPTSREEGDPTAWVRDVEERGISLGGWRLRDADAANSATVRVRKGETLVTRGPFAEAIEQVAGLDRIRVDDLDEALEVAAAHPTSWFGVIEVRPLWMT
jgi:hypothetical protein